MKRKKVVKQPLSVKEYKGNDKFLESAGLIVVLCLGVIIAIVISAHL